jgi:AraC-like DNA-binding protein
VSLREADGGSASHAHELLGTPTARELVPVAPGTSGRWHTHDYPGPYCRWNHHPEYEVHLIQNGTGRFIVGDHTGTFHAGQLVLVGPDLPHHWISDVAPGERVPHRDVVFQFHPQWIADCQQLVPELRALDPLLHRAERGVEFSITTAAAAAHHLVGIGQTSGVERVQHILAMLDTLARAPGSQCRPLASPLLPRPSHAGSADVVDHVLRCITEAVGREVRMAEVAKEVGMSGSAFSRYFTRAAGQSFSDTVRKMRMAHACQLLEQTELPVSTISRRVGYENLSNFNRQFRRQHGVTPGEYRRSQ